LANPFEEGIETLDAHAESTVAQGMPGAAAQPLAFFEVLRASMRAHSP
jgi:hypothetical protein